MTSATIDSNKETNIENLQIDVNNLSFGYNQDYNVLKDINIKIEPQKTTAIVGESGSGKSTLVKLLCRF